MPTALDFSSRAVQMRGGLDGQKEEGMRAIQVSTVAALLLSSLTHSASATVLCQKPSGALFVRATTCKRKETTVTAASIGAVGPSGPQGLQGPMGAPGTPATSLWAYVWETGELKRGSGATAATKAGSDYYEVTFNRDVSNCVALATPAKGSTNGVTANIFLYTVAGSVNPNQVEVDTESSTVTANPSAFTLAVFCP